MKYIISYRFEGTFECEAESAEEAADMFGELDEEALVKGCALEADEPMTAEQIAEWQSAAMSWIERLPKGEKV